MIFTHELHRHPFTGGLERAPPALPLVLGGNPPWRGPPPPEHEVVLCEAFPPGGVCGKCGLEGGRSGGLALKPHLENVAHGREGGECREEDVERVVKDEDVGQSGGDEGRVEG